MPSARSNSILVNMPLIVHAIRPRLLGQRTSELAKTILDATGQWPGFHHRTTRAVSAEDGGDTQNLLPLLPTATPPYPGNSTPTLALRESLAA
jgi:hypothetical protein